jgi:peroxin-6
LLKGARGSGKRATIMSVADEMGFSVVGVRLMHGQRLQHADHQVDCFDIVGESQAVTEGSLLAQFEKAKSAAPSIFLLHHIEALAKKAESVATGKVPPIVKLIDDLLSEMRSATLESGWPIVLMGTTVDEDSAPSDLLSCFKQDLSISVRVLHVSLIVRRLRLNSSGTQRGRKTSHRQGCLPGSRNST